MRRLISYKTEDGKVPYQEWLSGLRDKQTRLRIQKRLSRLEEGNFGDHRSVGAGVWEVRVDFGPGYRVYYGLDGDIVVVLLCGGDKGSQSRDIERAKSYWASYKEESR